MVKTPRVDERFFWAEKLRTCETLPVIRADYARLLETELVKANELLLKTNQAHIENQQLRKDLDGERETNQRLTDELVEVRAEIERKNALIEQLHVALKKAFKYPNTEKLTGTNLKCLNDDLEAIEAALSAAERGG